MRASLDDGIRPYLPWKLLYCRLSLKSHAVSRKDGEKMYQGAFQRTDEREVTKKKIGKHQRRSGKKT